MKILKLLTLKKSDKDQKAAERIARQLKRNQEKLVDDLDAKRDTLLAKKDELETVSLETATAKLDTWATDYHKTTVELVMVEKEIEIAKATLKDMFE